MRIQCPHCQNELNVVPGDDEGQLSQCPSCGSKFTQEPTVVYEPPPTQQMGRFELISVAGRGQFGEVWKAKDTLIDRIVALKLPRSGEIDNQTKALFLREARASASVKHANIVTVLDVGEIDGQIYIASEFINGITLREKLRGGRLPYRQLTELLVPIAEGIHEAHEAGITHRDLKPSNILLDESGTPFVADFGLAKQNAAEITLTVDGLILGTPAYMSPEQARGDSHHADRRSDVYSLGVILYEMLTGTRPFEGVSSLLLHQIQSEDPRTPRSLHNKIPRDLETICLKAIEKLPEKRYQTAEEFAADLKRFLKAEPIKARPVNSLERLWRRARRNPALSTSLIVSVICLVLLSASVLKGSKAPDSVIQATVIPEDVAPKLVPLIPPREFFKPADDQGPLTIKSSVHYACLEVGQSPKSFHYEIDAELQYPDSSIGFALGIHQIASEPAEYRCLIAFAGGRLPLQGTWLTIQDTMIKKNPIGLPAFHGHQLMSDQVSEINSGLVNINVDVEENKIVRIQVNGVEIDSEVVEEFPPLADNARVGIVCLGHVVVRDFQLSERSNNE